MPRSTPVHVAITDPGVDETWLQLTVEDIWDMVKRARRRKSLMPETLVLWFGTTAVEVNVMRARES